MSSELKTNPSPTRGLEDKLPPEVSDIIFDIVSDLDSQAKAPKQSLFSCSLVCKSWRQRTLRHRFRSLSLYVSLRGDDDEYDDEQDHPKHVVFVVGKFMRLGVFALVRDAVRSLTLRYGTATAPINIGRSFVHFVSQLTCLQSLELFGAPYSSSRGFVVSPVIASIKHLSICGATQRPNLSLHKLSALYDIIGAFSEIEELRLDGFIHPEEGSDDSELDDLALPHVMSLVLDSAPSVKQLAPVLQRLSATRRLQKLDVIACIDESRCRKALELVKSLPILPEHLLLLAPLDALSLDLQGLSGLNRITIAIEVYATTPRLDDPQGQYPVDSINRQLWTHATEVLASLDRAGHLEYIEFALMPPRNALDRTYPATLTSLGEAVATIEACEEMLIRMIREKRLSHVRVALWRTRPLSWSSSRWPSWLSAGSVRHIFPRLDELGVLAN